MIDELLLHPRSRDQLMQYCDTPGHAVLLVGATGTGKGHVAKTITATVLNIDPATLDQHPYFLRIQPDGASISIDAIRDLQRFLQLRTLGNDQPIRRAVVIEHAEALTTEAQNAFLKVLEEPPADTILVLTAANRQALLPTILSRTPIIHLHAPLQADVAAHFAQAEAQAFKQAYFLSGGLPGLMHALLNNDTSHPLMEGVTQAKAILQKTTFERLALVDSLSKQKESAQYVLEALQHIAQTGLEQSGSKADPKKVKQWHHILKATHEAQLALRQSANPKLTLSNLMLQL